MNVLLETERLVLRRFTAGDALLLYELDSDPEVMRYISRGQPTSLDRIEREILPRVLAYYAKSPPQGVWAAHLRTSEEFIGWFHLKPDKLEPEEMELGYRLKRSAWGCGLATEGSRALVQKGFEVWGCAKISARTLVGNVASRRVMEKAGLHVEKEFVYPVEMMPGWTEDERRAVKYSVNSELYRASSRSPSKGKPKTRGKMMGQNNRMRRRPRRAVSSDPYVLGVL